MSDILGRHTIECDLCKGEGICFQKRKYRYMICPQCKGKCYVVEDLDEQVRGIRRGDILLVKYRFDPIGWVIRRFTKCNYNHIAWFTTDKELIELKATGKRKVSLSHYLNKYLYKCKAIRIKDIDNCKLNEAVRRAEKAQFDYPYSSAILNFILIGLKILKKAPRLSCSAFPAYYLAQVGFYFDGKKTWFITPKDIEISKKCIDVTEELYQ